jgi:hypothetical protein
VEVGHGEEVVRVGWQGDTMGDGCRAHHDGRRAFSFPGFANDSAS